MSRRRLYVFLFDLKRTVLQVAAIRERNPAYQEGRPRVHVGICSGARPEERYSDRDFSDSRSRIVRRYARRIRNDHQSPHTRLEGAVSQRLRLIDHLRERRWLVSNPAPRPRHQVYVLELDPSLKQEPGVVARNPDADPEKSCLYVGRTAKDAEVRMREHQEGIRSGRYVEGSVVDLRTEFTGDLNGLTLLESLRAERHLANRLRREGYFVLGGH